MLDLPMIDVRKVSLAGGRHGPLDDVSAAVGPGEIVALLGAEGGGAVALIDVLTGLARPDGGELLIAGLPLQGAPPMRFVQQGVSWLRPGRALALAPMEGPSMLEALLRGEALAALPSSLRVLLLDGVAAAWAGGDARVIARRLRRLTGGREVAVLWAEPQPETLLSCVERALVFRAGRKQADGSPAEVTRHLAPTGAPTQESC